MTVQTMADVVVVKNYIGGEWVEAESTGDIDVFNPSTGELIAKCPRSTKAETDRAIAAAAASYTTWSQTRSRAVYRRSRIGGNHGTLVARYHIREAHLWRRGPSNPSTKPGSGGRQLRLALRPDG